MKWQKIESELRKMGKEGRMNADLAITEIFKAIISGIATGLAIFSANRFLENAKLNDARKRLAQIFSNRPRNLTKA